MRKACIGTLGAAALLASVSQPVYASSQDEANVMSMEACEYPSGSKFKFTFFYSSNLKGQYRNVGYNVYDLSAVRIGGSNVGSHVLRYCGSMGPGAGMQVKNNAASAQNRHGKYKADVHFNSGYKGARDRLTPGSSLFRLKHTYNQNASMKFTS
ncbi:hypothetical protein SMD44_03771 [Streptomyces alboflavus]|uniref:Uncharacterized protein n=1 Tax=Streptomyces alboflavus TaxID=67267 RepID=A0A1Z1WD02_9ACTN|nr:hypothetical protein SMD44_03771 [Streptomyces alboflavus]